MITPLFLFVRWHLNTVINVLRFPLASDRWDMGDVGMIIKTGFSTREHILARLDVLDDGRNQSSVVLVSDYLTSLHSPLSTLVGTDLVLASRLIPPYCKNMSYIPRPGAKRKRKPKGIVIAIISFWGVI